MEMMPALRTVLTKSATKRERRQYYVETRAPDANKRAGLGTTFCPAAKPMGQLTLTNKRERQFKSVFSIGMRRSYG